MPAYSCQPGAKITPYELRIRIEDEDYLYFYGTMGQMLHYVSRIIAFNDCETEDVDIVSIRANGRELQYCGWQPGMVYSYRDADTKEIVWTNDYPEWDH